MTTQEEIPVHRWRNHKRPIPYGSSTMHYDGNWYYPKHTHQGYCEFVCVHEGAFWQRINHEERHVQRARSIVLIRENDVHELWGEDFVMTNTMISLAWLAELEALWGGSHLDRQLFASSHSPACQLNAMQWKRFLTMLHRIEIPGSPETRTARFTQFIVFLLFEHFLQPHCFDEAGEGMPAWLDDTLAWITSQGNKPLRVEDIVEYSELSGEHVSRSFKKYLGMSPSRYLNRERLRRAASLLRDTTLPVLEICFTVGFDNPSYFHRLFRGAYGTTPRDYRLSNALPMLQ